MSERVKKPIRTAEEWFQFERQAREQGFTTVCGVDEAGRGPLAGPVYAAAVILPPGLVIEGVNDSKKLSEKKREALFPIICEQALAFGIGYATEEEIDTYNILQATYMAMRRAVWELKHAGWFGHVKGFLIGRPLHFGEEIMGLDQYRAVTDLLAEYGVPVIMDADLGHLPPSMPILCGAMGEVTVRDSDIRICYGKE